MNSNTKSWEIRKSNGSVFRIIPCIDLMGGKVVQLVQGESKALELESIEEAVEKFRGFPLLHIIDLDAAKGLGSNREMIAALLTKVRARVGGGVRTVGDATALLEIGAKQVIVGTAAFTATGIDSEFLASLVGAVGRSRIIVAIDVKAGCIAVRGWRETLSISPAEVVARLEPYCAGFLCTCVDREGMLQGTDLSLFLDLRSRTDLTLIAAGGITSRDEVRALTDAGIQVALGMAVYTGRLSLDDLRGI